MSLLSHEDRQRVRQAVNDAKRAAIATARGITYEPWDDEPHILNLDPDRVRQRLNAGERGKDLALEYGVAESTISEIRNGRRR